MNILYGAPLAGEMLGETRKLIKELHRIPVLSVICDNVKEPYIKGIMKDADICGVRVIRNVTDPQFVHGIISLDKHWVPDPEVDVDGGYSTPCTAEAIVAILKYWNVPIAGKKVCVIGRSNRVGRPLLDLLLNANATVTVCHSKTGEGDLYWHMSNCDILISCVGEAGFIGEGTINQYTTVVDVGNDFINYGACNALVPFVGGVGPVTRAVLMRHVYLKAKEKEDQ